MTSETILVGIGMLVLSLLGGIWIAYQLLSRTVNPRIEDLNDRIKAIETGLNGQTLRLDREIESRHQAEKGALDGRLNLAARILVLENKAPRIEETGKGE